MHAGAYREATWSAEDEGSLIIRVEPGENERWTLAGVLSKYKTRSALAEHFLKTQRIVRVDLSGMTLALPPTLPDMVEVRACNARISGGKLPALPLVELLDVSDSNVDELPALPRCKALNIERTKIAALPPLPCIARLYVRGSRVDVSTLPGQCVAAIRAIGGYDHTRILRAANGISKII